jgi:hypothetical protein
MLPCAVGRIESCSRLEFSKLGLQDAVPQLLVAAQPLSPNDPEENRAPRLPAIYLLTTAHE